MLLIDWFIADGKCATLPPSPARTSPARKSRPHLYTDAAYTIVAVSPNRPFWRLGTAREALRV